MKKPKLQNKKRTNDRGYEDGKKAENERRENGEIRERKEREGEGRRGKEREGEGRRETPLMRK